MKGNNHHPHVLKREIVFAVLSFVLLIEAVVLAQGLLIFRNPGYMASVLPAVVADLVNSQRTDTGLQALTVNPLLTEAAQDKANDMAAKGYFAHVSPDGTLPWYWFKLVGYNYQFAGENLAVNFDDSNDVVTAWMNSPTHKANILKQQYTETGIGVATGMYEGKETTFIVQEFASPAPAEQAPAAAPTPVETPTASPASPGSGQVAINTPSVQNVPAPTELMTTNVPAANAPTNISNPVVLGAETSAVPATPAAKPPVSNPSEIQTLLASPFSTGNEIFVMIGAFFLAVLIAGIIYRKRLPRMTATIGGLSVVVVVLGFAIINTHFLSNKVQIDQVGAASVFTSLNQKNY